MGTTRQHSASLVVCTDHEVAWDPFGGYQEEESFLDGMEFRVIYL